MKRIKCYLSILLVISMMLCSTSMFTVNAAQATETEDVVVDTEANLGGEDELQPMMANSCWTDGSTYKSTVAGLNRIGGIAYSGTGQNIIFDDPAYSIRQSQCGSDFCVFVYYNDVQTYWFKVKAW